MNMHYTKPRAGSHSYACPVPLTEENVTHLNGIDIGLVEGTWTLLSTKGRKKQEDKIKNIQFDVYPLMINLTSDGKKQVSRGKKQVRTNLRGNMPGGLDVFQ